KLTHKDRSYRKFGSSGELTVIGDAASREITLSYSTVSGNHRLVSVMDASVPGRSITFGYDGTDVTKLVSITTPLGASTSRKWSLDYSDSMLSQIKTPLDLMLGIAYDDSSRITAITDQNGNAVALA